MKKLQMKSPSIANQNVEKIKEIFPNAVVETKDENSGKLRTSIDFDVLKQDLSNEIIDGPQERYQFSWPEKRKSILLANVQTTNTVRPSVNDSKQFEKTGNVYIDGDNLEALKIIHETYMGRVKMIYIDPPYNTGSDFVYKDNYSLSASALLDKQGDIDEQGNRLIANNSSNGRFHTDWLNMMYPRLLLAKDLLSDDGVIFISIDDNEVDNLKKICSEIFGESNFIGCAGRITKKSNNKGDFWAPNFDYIVTFTKNREFATPFTGGANVNAYSLVEEDGPRKGEKYQLVRLYMSSLKNRNPEQRFWIDCPDGSKIIPPGSTFPPERPNLGDGIWRWSRPTFEANKDKIVIKKVNSSNLLNENHQQASWNVFTKTYLNDVLQNSSAKPNSFIENQINQIASHELNELGIPFDYAKPTSLIKYLMEVSQVGNNDIVMDFFSGSGTTGDAVMQYNAENGTNAKYILVQVDQPIDPKEKAFRFLESINKKTVVSELGKERLRRAGEKIVKETNLLSNNVDTGFRDFTIDSSNMKDVFYTPSEFTANLLDDASTDVKGDRSSLDLLFQVMLELGITLDATIEERSFEKVHFYCVNRNDLVACLDGKVGNAESEYLASLKPLTIVFRDDSFSSDDSKVNCEQIIKTISPGTKFKEI